VQAVNGISLQVQKGEFTAVIGPSGCGKTTLLNMIGGLDSITSYNLIPVLTARENIEFIMELQGVSSSERSVRSRGLLESVGIAEKSEIRPGKLSGGQQQRVAVARALASKPEFVLADEPTANLDSHATTDLLDMMLEMNQTSGVTFVFATHDQRVIDRARRVVALDDGEIVSDSAAT
jgi:putative ABC transport system ATP-binding protein